MNENNMKKSYNQLITTIKKEETIQFFFDNYLYTIAVKLNIKQQMTFLIVKININITNEIILFTTLY